MIFEAKLSLSVGFTGTRQGMSDKQKKVVEIILKTFIPMIDKAHHGWCIGADEEFDDLCHNAPVEIPTVGWPASDVKPEYVSQKTPRPGTILHPASPALLRNEEIVNRSDLLIATPLTHETQRSGTWATVRYAYKNNKQIFLVLRNGNVIMEYKNVIMEYKPS